MTLLPLVQQLDRLASALTHLDHAAVESCNARLEETLGDFGCWPPAEAPARNELEQLWTNMQFCRVLTRNAERLYAGWDRIASFSGAAYTARGSEPDLVRSAPLAVQG